MPSQLLANKHPPPCGLFHVQTTTKLDAGLGDYTLQCCNGVSTCEIGRDDIESTILGRLFPE